MAAPGPPGTARQTGRAVPGRLLGSVRSVGTGGAFVLVETYGAESIETVGDGQSLQTEPGDGSPGNGGAVLRVARERRPPFIVADVVSGRPQPGDAVYLLPTAPAQYNPVPRPSANPPPPAASPLFPLPDSVLRQTL